MGVSLGAVARLGGFMVKFLLKGLFYSVFFATALTLMMAYFDVLTY